VTASDVPDPTIVSVDGASESCSLTPSGLTVSAFSAIGEESCCAPSPGWSVLDTSAVSHVASGRLTP